MADRLGARKNDSFKAVSTAPSFNKTPVGATTPPLPYPTVQDLANALGPVASVRLNGRPTYVLDQTTQPSCKRDNAGVAKGVKSGTLNGEVKPTQGSTTTRVGGHAVIRDGDPCTMNGGNNPGLYVTVPAVSGTAPAAAGRSTPSAKAETEEEANFFDRAAKKLKEAGQYYKDNVSESLHGFADGAMDSGGKIAAAGGAASTVGGGMAETLATAGDVAAEFATTGAVPNPFALVTAFAQRLAGNKVDQLTSLVPNRKRKRDDKKEPPKSGSGNNGFKTEGTGEGGCGIKPFKDQTCPTGQQAHHIVPDYALRYGNRADGAKGINRIPGMPSLDDGPSICLTGGSKVKNSDHNKAHDGTDPKIAALGDRKDKGPLGVAPIGDIIEISIDEVGKVKPHCQAEIKKKVDDAFSGVDRKAYGRTTQNPPPKDSEAHSTLSSQTAKDKNMQRDHFGKTKK